MSHITQRITNAERAMPKTLPTQAPANAEISRVIAFMQPDFDGPGPDDADPEIAEIIRNLYATV